MRNRLPARLWIGIWAVWISFFALSLSDLVPEAHARSYKRRQREKYECRASQEPANLDLDKARRLWESGMIYYDSSEYGKARADFQTAYDISHLPDFLVNLGQVTEKLEQYADAIKYLESYLQECPGAPEAPLVRQRIEDMRIALAIREGAKPPPKTIRLPPTPALVLLGIGAGMMIIGGGLGGGAIAAGHEVGNSANQGLTFGADLQSTERRGQALQNAGIAMDVIGAAFLITGISWTGIWLDEQRRGLSLALAPQVGGFVLSGGF